MTSQFLVSVDFLFFSAQFLFSFCLVSVYCLLSIDFLFTFFQYDSKGLAMEDAVGIQL